MNEKLKALEHDLREVLAKPEHKDVAGVIIIKEDYSDEQLICGTMCIVCALEMLYTFVALSGMQHDRNMEHKPAEPQTGNGQVH